MKFQRLSTCFILYVVITIVKAEETEEWNPFFELAGVKIGFSRVDVERLLGEPLVETERFMDYPDQGFSVILTKNDIVYGFACGSGCDPSRILADRFKFVTPKGIGIDSKMEEVTKAYGDPTRIKRDGAFTQIYYGDNASDTILVFILDELGVRNIHSADLRKLR